jgi:hypothetical protein
LLNTSSNKGNSMAAWTAMGPTRPEGLRRSRADQCSSLFHPDQATSIIWVGSPSGGL